jgi:hypothetical protein
MIELAFRVIRKLILELAKKQKCLDGNLLHSIDGFIECTYRRKHQHGGETLRLIAARIMNHLQQLRTSDCNNRIDL